MKSSRLERRIGACNVSEGYAVLGERGNQSKLVMCPDPVAQIIKQLEDGHRLLGRPVRIDEQFQSLVQTGRLMMPFHGDTFVFRCRELAAARSCASLRR